MENKAYHSGESEADNSQTPDWVINQIQKIANVTIVHDVCATEASSKSGEYYWSKEDDALNQDWDDLYNLFAYYGASRALYLNPPFSQAKEFTTKAANEALKGVVTIGCVKHAPDVTWFQEMEKRATVIYVPDGRINFLKADGSKFKNGANFPVCFPLWTPFNHGGMAKYVRFKRDKNA